MVEDAGDAIARDPEVRQARTIAEAARTRLVACVSGREGDLTEAQGMLDALRSAQVLAGDAEDRVLVHRGLLTAAEADKRAARRRPVFARGGATPGADVPDLRISWPGFSWPRFPAVRVIAGVLALVILGFAGAALAQRGVRLPLTRR